MAGDNPQASHKREPAGQLEYHANGRLPAETPNESNCIAQSVWSGAGAMEYFRLMYAAQRDGSTSGGIDRGPIVDIDVPQGWRRREASFGSLGLSSSETFSPPGDNSTTLGIYHSGMRAGAEAARAFLSILKNKPADDGTQELTPDEIKSLSEIMGRYQAGDNQYTNSGRYRAPAFELTKAYTMQVNGRTVLAVEGNFKGTGDDAGTASMRQYKGIFADSDGTGTRIEQVFMSTAPGKMREHARAFNETLSSIKWK